MNCNRDNCLVEAPFLSQSAEPYALRTSVRITTAGCIEKVIAPCVCMGVGQHSEYITIMNTSSNIVEISETTTPTANVAPADVSTDLVLSLRTVATILPEGANLGRFLVPKIDTRTVKDEVRRILVVPVEFEAKDDAGHPFVLSREYNVSGLGVTAFSSDIKSWRGTGLNRDELAKFNATKILLDKPVTAVVAHRTVGRKTTPYIQTFAPVPTAPGSN